MAYSLIQQNAVEIVGQLRRGDITPHHLLDALEERIALVDPIVNALPTRCFDRARQHADRLERFYPDWP
jgi:amidase